MQLSHSLVTQRWKFKCLSTAAGHSDSWRAANNKKKGLAKAERPSQTLVCCEKVLPNK
jgi:hypothetical protein